MSELLGVFCLVCMLGLAIYWCVMQFVPMASSAVQDTENYPVFDSIRATRRRRVLTGWEGWASKEKQRRRMHNKMAAESRRINRMH